MPQKYDDVIIDVDFDLSRSSPALGQLDKLLKQSALETQSLQVVRRMLMRDMFDRAKVTGVTKLTAAAKQRLLTNGANGHAPPGYFKNGTPWPDDPAQPKKKRGGRSQDKAGRKSHSERLDEIRHYLHQHPGADTLTAAKGLKWRPNQVSKFARQIATSQKQGHREPLRWFLNASAARTKTTKVMKVLKRRSRADRQAAIRNFLTQKPEAYTRDVAKALRLKPNSSFVKILRTVAQPLRPTVGTQPIQWVLPA